MGYYVNIEESTTVIPVENLDEAFERMKALNKRDDLKTGGSWGPNGQTRIFFAWMTEDYDQTASDAADIFNMLGFYTDMDTDGLHLNEFDSKIGAEEHFLDAIKDLVAPGSYIIWRGEDGAKWKWTPRGTFQGRTVFDEPEEQSAIEPIYDAELVD